MASETIESCIIHSPGNPLEGLDGEGPFQMTFVLMVTDPTKQLPEWILQFDATINEWTSRYRNQIDVVGRKAFEAIEHGGISYRTVIVEYRRREIV